MKGGADSSRARRRAVSAWAVVSVPAGLPLGAPTGTFASSLMKFSKYSAKEQRLIPRIPMFPDPDFLLGSSELLEGPPLSVP